MSTLNGPLTSNKNLRVNSVQNLIALDLGTSSFRGYLLNKEGRILEIIEVEEDAFKLFPAE